MYSCTFELTAKTCLQVSNATGQEAPEDDQEVPGDTVMNDTESESDIEEISAGAALSVPMQEVCLSFFFLNVFFLNSRPSSNFFEDVLE